MVDSVHFGSIMLTGCFWGFVENMLRCSYLYLSLGCREGGKVMTAEGGKSLGRELLSYKAQEL